MKAIFDGSTRNVGRGAVPGPLYATSKNAVDDKPLLRGPEIFPAMRRMIASARQEVDLQTFVWDSDSDAGREIIAGLADLARRHEAQGGQPVLVRMLVDVTDIAGGTWKQAAQFSRSVEAVAAPEHLKVEVASFHHFALGNLHSKTLVVDHRSAIVTGANVQKSHDYADPWFDSGYVVHGEVAHALREDFDFSYRKGKRWLCGGQERHDDCEGPTRLERPEATPTLDPELEGACLPILVTTRANDQNPLANRTNNTQDEAFLAAIGAAQRLIRIHTPNLNDDALKKALIQAMVERPELSVELVLSRKFNEREMNLPGQGGGNEENADKLFEALSRAHVPNRCERLRVRWYSHDGVSPVDGNGAHASHAKYASFDGQVAIVGSANMDTQAWNFSKETNIAVDSAEVVAAWDRDMFGASFARAIPRPCSE